MSVKPPKKCYTFWDPEPFTYQVGFLLAVGFTRLTGRPGELGVTVSYYPRYSKDEGQSGRLAYALRPERPERKCYACSTTPAQ